MTALISWFGSSASLRRRCRGVYAVPPIARHEVHFQAEIRGHFCPERSELAGLERQYPVAGTQRIDQSGLPCAAARRRKDDHGVRGAEHGLNSLQAPLGHFGEFSAAMVDDRVIDRAKHPVRNVRGSGYL